MSKQLATIGEVFIDPAPTSQRPEEADATRRQIAVSQSEYAGLIQNLEFHQRELEAQNAELMQMRLVLEESRRRYLDFYRLAPVGFCTIDRQGLVLGNNLAMTRLLGLAVDALVGKELFCWVDVEERPSYMAAIDDVMEWEREAVLELRLRSEQGALCWTRMTAKLAYGGDGSPEIHLVFCDLSRKKKALLALSHQEAQNRALERAIPDVILSYRRGELCLRDFGVAGNAAAALRSVLPAGILRRIKRAADVALKTDVIQEVRYKLHTEARRHRYFEARIAPSIDDTVVIVVRDVTDWELARRQREHDFLSSLSAIDAERVEVLRNMSMAGQMVRMGTWTRTPHSSEYSVSEYWCALFGFDSADRISIAQVFERIHPSDRPDPAHPLRCGPASGGENYHELRVRLPGGGERWVGLFHQTELDQYGQVKLWRGVSLDITKNKRAELELQQKRMEVLHLARVSMLGALSGALAHELNQPLTSILCNAQAAIMGLGNQKLSQSGLQDVLQDIVDADLRAGAVIRRLRRLFNNGEPQLAPVALGDLVQEATDILGNDLINQGWTVTLEQSTTPLMVLADAVQIQQVVINLLMNACEAGASAGVEDGQIAIRITQTSSESAQVQVIDNGPGIADELLHSLFDSFRTTKSQGMGLGLSICRSIINSHHGRIWAENHAPHGACMVFSLPLVGASRASG